MGTGIRTNQLMKMVGGAIVPGYPVANLYVYLDDGFYYFRITDSISVCDVEP